MTLGEHITALRAEHHMSQGDLAERLNVSRQSVSKWETNTSVPDLDKLIALSQVFDITLDELVKGPYHTKNTSAEDTSCSFSHGTDAESQFHVGSDSTTIASYATHVSDTQRIVGFILLTVGLLGTVLGLVLTSNLMLLSLLLVLYGILCLTIKRHVGLIIGWITLIPSFFILPYMTGMTPLSLLYMLRYLGDAKMNLAMLIALFYWICVLVMAIITWRTLRKKSIH